MVSLHRHGAASALVPIGWVVFTAILLYNITVETGKFQLVKDSSAATKTGGCSAADRFAFGAFIEGAALRTPVAVSAAMLAGWDLAVLRRPASACSPTRAGGIRLDCMRPDRDAGRHPASPRRLAPCRACLRAVFAIVPAYL